MSFSFEIHLIELGFCQKGSENERELLEWREHGAGVCEDGKKSISKIHFFLLPLSQSFWLQSRRREKCKTLYAVALIHSLMYCRGNMCCSSFRLIYLEIFKSFITLQRSQDEKFFVISRVATLRAT